MEKRPIAYRLIGLLAGLALLTPLLTAKALGGPVMLKAGIFQWLTLMMAAAYLTLIAQDARYRPNFRNPLTVAALSWLAVLLIVLPFSQNPELSFWSNRDRMSGTVSFAYLTAWFLVLSSTYRSWREWRYLLAGANFVCLLAGGFGLLELAAEHEAGHRIVSTLGNAIYLSYYVLPHVAIAAILAIRAERWPSRLLYLVSIPIHATVIVLTATRGAVLALAFGTVVGAFGYLLLVLKSRRQAILAGTAVILALLLIGGTVGWSRFTDGGRAWGEARYPSQIQRILYHDFGSDRLSLWRMGIEGWKERPAFGHGLENYADVLDRHIDSTRDSALSQNWYDRSHNQFIDVLIGTGAFGLLAYLALWASALYLAVQKARRAEDRRQKATFWIAVPLVLAQAFALFFAFDTPNASIILWLALAMLVGLPENDSGDGPEDGVADRKKHRRGRQGDSDGAIVLLFTLLALAFAAGWLLNWRPYAQAADYNRLMSGYQADPAGTAEALRECLEKPRFAVHDLRFNMLTRVRRLSEGYLMDRESIRPLAELSAAEIEKTLANRPNNFKTLLAAAYAYRELGTYDRAHLTRAREMAEKSVLAAPNRPEGYEELAEIAFLEGKPLAALQELDRAAAASRHAATDFRIAFRRIAALALSGEMAAADREMAEIVRSYEVGLDLRNMADFPPLLSLGDDYPGLIGYYRRLALNNMGHPRVLAQCALATHNIGDRESTDELIGAIRKISPAWADLLTRELGL